MAKKKQKYYVVWMGVEPGIYTSWTECQLQIKGFAGAKYKAFTSMQEAEMAYGGNPRDHIGKSPKTTKKKRVASNKKIISNSLSVDAACSGSPGIMEYQGVWTGDSTRIPGPCAWYLMVETKRDGANTDIF